MPKPEHDHSIHAEPHLRPGAATGPESEHSASREPIAEAAGLRVQADEGGSHHSVHDEPGIFPSDEPREIDRDWSCGHCGYNLRGLIAGRRCPECGRIELYRPPPPGARGYAHWLWSKAARATPRSAWIAITCATLAGGLLAVVGTFFTVARTGMGVGGQLLQSVLMAPPVEEVMKLAAAAILVERMPYLLRHRWQLMLIGVGSGLGFAVIENVLYLNLYFPNSGIRLILWRWIVCTTLHVSCTYISVRGLTNVWERTIREGRPPRMSLAGPALTTAIVIHAVYNAGATALDFLPVF